MRRSGRCVRPVPGRTGATLMPGASTSRELRAPITSFFLKCADFFSINLHTVDFAGALHDPVAATVFCAPQKAHYNRQQQPRRRREGAHDDCGPGPGGSAAQRGEPETGRAGILNPSSRKASTVPAEEHAGKHEMRGMASPGCAGSINRFPAGPRLRVSLGDIIETIHRTR